MLLMSKGSKEALTVLIVTRVTHVEGVERSLNSSYCYSCYSCRKGRKITLCTQYRYIQYYVERVERLCYAETKDIHIFAHNFLNIQRNFQSTKSFGKLRLRPFQLYHPMLCMSKGRKLFWLSTPLTCFDIHSTGWYGWKGLSLSFSKLFADWKSVEY